MDLCIGFLIPIALLDGAASKLVPENPMLRGCSKSRGADPEAAVPTSGFLSMARQSTPEAIVVKRRFPLSNLLANGLARTLF
jgi:hypothetical protein